MPRFSILVHDHPFPHWDLFLDPGDEGLLWAWRLADEPDPAGDGSQAIVATRQPDHRRIYLQYEGPVGGDRGTVTPWDQGVYELADGSDSPQSDKNDLKLKCQGKKLLGQISLSRVSGSDWAFKFQSTPH